MMNTSHPQPVVLEADSKMPRKHELTAKHSTNTTYRIFVLWIYLHDSAEIISKFVLYRHCIDMVYNQI